MFHLFTLDAISHAYLSCFSCFSLISISFPALALTYHVISAVIITNTLTRIWNCIYCYCYYCYLSGNIHVFFLVCALSYYGWEVCVFGVATSNRTYLNRCSLEKNNFEYTFYRNSPILVGRNPIQPTCFVNNISLRANSFFLYFPKVHSANK